MAKNQLSDQQAPVKERLSALRRQMALQKIDACIIPSSDPHQSEYVAPHWKAREWISGFTGSAGTVVITAGHAGLWTDSRYFLQAETELKDSSIELHRQLIPHAPEHIPWLSRHLPQGATVGVDGYLFSKNEISYMQGLFQSKGIHLKTDVDLMSKTWAGRPSLPQSPVFEHELVYAGKSRKQKLEEVRQIMKELEADLHLIPTLDDIAWTLNIRAADVDFNPVAYAYLIIEQDSAHLFIDQHKIPADLREKLIRDGVRLHEYQQILHFLEGIPTGKSLLADPAGTSIRLLQALPADQILTGNLIPRGLKAIKNEVEIAHIRRIMVKDGVALLRLFRWLEGRLQNGQTPDEAEIAEQLAHFRSRQEHYIGESFPAIVGYQANGAIIHYRPQPGACAKVRQEGILLLDSGGQYLDGTTDITRTVALSLPTEEQKQQFTLVLKGHIALDRLQFPAGTSGGQLDAFARQFLWQHGLNYGHGTGHGVGFFLNVHEPPQGFASSVVTSRGSSAIEAGMLTSNEPGFYQNGSHGIRIENLILCVEKEKTEFGTFLAFETLTFFPIDTQLIKTGWLSPEEKEWLNSYHRKVQQALSPYLSAAEKVWLEGKCQAI